MTMIAKKAIFTLIALILVLSCAYGIFLDYKTAYATINYGSEWEVNPAASTYHDIAKLSSTQVVVVYRDSDTFGRAALGTYNESAYVDFEDDVTFYAGALTTNPLVAPLTSSTFVVVYNETSCVGTVDGSNVITFGATTALPATTDASYYRRSVDQLSSSSFLLTYTASADSDGYAVVGTITGGVITYGTPKKFFEGTLGGFCDATVLTSSLIVVGYSSAASVIAATVSGTTISDFGAAVALPTGGSSMIYLDRLTNTRFVVAYGESGDNVTALVGDIAVTTITIGSDYNWRASLSNKFSVAYLTSTTFVITNSDSLDTGHGKAIIGSVGAAPATAITYDDAALPYEFVATNLGTVEWCKVVGLDATRFVTVYKNTNGAATVGNTQSFAVSAPDVTTDAETTVTENAARLNGTLDFDGGATCEYRFGLGTATGDYWYTAWSIGAALVTGNTFLYDASGLDPGTTYYFIAQCSNGSYVDSGSERNFTTTGSPPGLGEPPAVTTQAATNIIDVFADINGSLDQLGDYGTVYTFFEYDVVSHAVDGLPYVYKTAEADQTGIADLTETVALYPELTWYFRISCRYNTYSYIHGLEKFFNTLPDSGASTDPRVVTQAATEITTSSAVLHGVLLSLGTYTTVYTAFQYCTDGDYTAGDGSTVTTDYNNFTVGSAYLASVASLAPYVTYHFRAVGFYGYGTGSYVYGSDLIFTTGTSPLPPIPSHDITCTDANYGYYAPLIVANTSASDYTHQRVSFTTPASQLVTAMIIQSDADDVMMTELDDTTEVGLIANNLGSAAATWHTGLIDISANSSEQYDLWMGKATAVNTQQWVSVSGDTVTTADSASLDIQNNLTVEVSFTPAVLAGTQTLFNKTGAYSLVLSTANIVGTVTIAAAAKTVTVAADPVDASQRWKMTYVSATGVKLFKYTGGAWVQQGATTAATGDIDTNANNATLMATFTGYVDWIKVGGTDVVTPTNVLDLEFQPDQISSTAITDQMALQTTTYTLTANSSGVTGTLYGLVPACTNGASQFAGATPAATDIANIPQDYFGVPDTGGKLASNPIYPFVHAIAEQTTFSETQIWRILAGFILILAMIVVAKYIPGHIMATAVTLLLFCSLFTALTIFPYWTVIVSAIFTAWAYTSERSPVV